VPGELWDGGHVFALLVHVLGLHVEPDGESGVDGLDCAKKLNDLVMACCKPVGSVTKQGV